MQNYEYEFIRMIKYHSVVQIDMTLLFHLLKSRYHLLFWVMLEIQSKQKALQFDWPYNELKCMQEVLAISSEEHIVIPG